MALVHEKFLFKNLLFKKLIPYVLVNAVIVIISYYNDKALSCNVQTLC